MSGSNQIRWLIIRTKPHAGLLTMSFIAATASGIVAVVDPLLMRYWLDVTLPERKLAESLGMVLLIALCFVGRSAINGASSLLSFRVSQHLGMDLRSEVLCHMGTLSADWHERMHVGEKLSRIEQDVEQIAQFATDALSTILRSVLFFALNLAIMFRLDWRMALTVLPILPLFLYVRSRFRGIIAQKADQSQAEIGQSTADLAEYLGAVPQLQLLGAEQRRAGRAINMRLRSVAAQWSQRKAEIGFSVSVTSVLAAAILCLLGLGTHEYLRGALSVGSLVAFYAYVTRVFEPVSSAMELYARSQRMLASGRRVSEVLETQPSVEDKGTMAAIPVPLTHGFVCKSVVFSYPNGKPVLHELDFSIGPGARIGIVGRNGSGKSSLARILARVADPSAGLVTLEARSLTEYRLDALRNAICYVPQHPVLFSGTIRENLLYAAPAASDRRMAPAIKTAQLEEVLLRLPRGLETPLGPEAAGLSGGEQQRLALARALLRESPVLILDEATSALDLPTESAVFQALAGTSRNQTIVVISPRLKSLTWLDRILVLDAGSVVAEGSHADLYRTCTLYRNLFDRSGELPPPKENLIQKSYITATPTAAS